MPLKDRRVHELTKDVTNPWADGRVVFDWTKQAYLEAGTRYYVHIDADKGSRILQVKPRFLLNKEGEKDPKGVDHWLEEPLASAKLATQAKKLYAPKFRDYAKLWAELEKHLIPVDDEEAVWLELEQEGLTGPEIAAIVLRLAKVSARTIKAAGIRELESRAGNFVGYQVKHFPH